MSQPEFLKPSTLAPPLGLYSHVALVGPGSQIAFIAGQLGVRPDGTLPTSLREQAEETFANILRALKGIDMGLANLVRINTYLVAGQSGAEVREVRLRLFGDHRPASTFIYVPQLVLPQYLIEIDAVAAR
jgi:enamine deaminase RidA (YjgF/YER057c/UK114 family)